MKDLFKYLMVTAAVLVASSASAEFLYWQVDSDDPGVEFQEAWLIAENKDTHEQTLLDVVDAQSDGKSTALTQTSLEGLDTDAYLYYVEMCNYVSDANYDVVATGYKYGYGDLVSQGYISSGVLDATGAAAAGIGGNMGSAIPEPSGGLLLLMGGALLALRRRRQK